MWSSPSSGRRSSIPTTPPRWSSSSRRSRRRPASKAARAASNELDRLDHTGGRRRLPRRYDDVRRARRPPRRSHAAGRLAPPGDRVTVTASLSAATRAIEALLDTLEAHGIVATRDPGAFYPQPLAVLVGLPTLTKR